MLFKISKDIRNRQGNGVGVSGDAEMLLKKL